MISKKSNQSNLSIENDFMNIKAHIHTRRRPLVRCACQTNTQNSEWQTAAAVQYDVLTTQETYNEWSSAWTKKNKWDACVWVVDVCASHTQTHTKKWIYMGRWMEWIGLITVRCWSQTFVSAHCTIVYNARNRTRTGLINARKFTGRRWWRAKIVKPFFMAFVLQLNSICQCMTGGLWMLNARVGLFFTKFSIHLVFCGDFTFVLDYWGHWEESGAIKGKQFGILENKIFGLKLQRMHAVAQFDHFTQSEKSKWNSNWINWANWAHRKKWTTF